MSAPAASMVLYCAEETCRCVGGEEEEGSICTTKPEKTIVLDKKESERQISVDPISLMTHPVTTGPRIEMPSVPLHHPHLLPTKSSGKFISSSLPSSASSSPCLAFTKQKKKKYKNHVAGPLARQHSVALGNLERLRESHLRKSKSCGEGRACQPSVDFDLWSPSFNNQRQRDNQTTDQERRVERKHAVHKKEGGSYEEKFKCGACLFLPGLGLGLGKGKTVRARKDVDVESGMAHIEDLIASQRVSLEKFECGSWRSSAIIYCEEDGGGGGDVTSNLFFDLPVELIRCGSSVNDAESPVTTGFVFDNHHRKGVLKSRKSQEPACSSSRHVRFSTSSPTSSSSSCITPRLHKARDDFNAFLEAQSA